MNQRAILIRRVVPTSTTAAARDLRRMQPDGRRDVEEEGCSGLCSHCLADHEAHFPDPSDFTAPPLTHRLPL